MLDNFLLYHPMALPKSVKTDELGKQHTVLISTHNWHSLAFLHLK